MYELYSGRHARHAERTAWLEQAKHAKHDVSQNQSSSGTGEGTSSPNHPKKDGKRKGGKRASYPKDGGAVKEKKEKKGSKKRRTKSTTMAISKDKGIVARGATPNAAPPAGAIDGKKSPEGPPKPLCVVPGNEFLARMKAAGVDTSKPREQWPRQTLRKVFLELSAAAPYTLLADEVRLGAADVAHWWRRQRAFATSTAAWSVLGWLLGLGDRHLDNILMHSVMGAVVHVDFGVMFDRGAKLAVPEVVPFRLTQSFVAGLGPAGE